MPAASCCITPLLARSSAVIRRLCWPAEFDWAPFVAEGSTTIEATHSGKDESREATMNYTAQYLREAIQIMQQLDSQAIERLLGLLVQVRTELGRIFFLGVGGGAGHASHAVNDFRKIAGVECYAPTDNVSELTARVNDDGWDTGFAEWLKGSRLRREDMVLVLSVGGGDLDRNISACLVRALELARKTGAAIGGIV